MTTTTFLTVAVFAALSAAVADRDIPSNCTCKFESLSGGGICENNPACYPNHQLLNIAEECLPTVSENSRVCFRTKVKTCRDENNYPFHTCRFFPGPINFRMTPLSRNCPNSIEFSSVEDSELRTICIYNVNMSGNSNCSALRLQHVVDHPEEEYIDSLNVSHSCHNSNSVCKDYLKIYYGEGNQQSRALCREELANLDTILEASSFVAVFWSDSVSESGTASSFHIRAECLEYAIQM